MAQLRTGGAELDRLVGLGAFVVPVEMRRFACLARLAVCSAAAGYRGVGGKADSARVRVVNYEEAPGGDRAAAGSARAP